MRACLICFGLVVSGAIGCSDRARQPDPEFPKADLGQARISADGSAAVIAQGGTLTATAGGDLLVEGLLEIDADADFKPSITTIRILRSKPDGGTVTADSAKAKTEAVPDRDNLYRFRAVLTAPKEAGSYRILGDFKGKTFCEGVLNVSM